MKQRLLLLLITLSGDFSINLAAQVSLPYYSGFDTPGERNGWSIYRLGDMTASNWSVATVSSYSEPACISHDYSPSTGIDVVDDWYVSPGFLIPAGGVLDSVRYAFSGFSVPAEGDTIGVYLLIGAQDPASASQIIELEEFRNDEYQTDNIYRLLTGIHLPETNEMAFIGLRYRNAEASSRWLHVRFDNIAVSESTTSVDGPVTANNLFVYPNPAADKITINHNKAGGIALIYDHTGKLVEKYTLADELTSTMISIGRLPKGIYRLLILQADTFEGTSIIIL